MTKQAKKVLEALQRIDFSAYAEKVVRSLQRRMLCQCADCRRIRKFHKKFHKYR